MIHYFTWSACSVPELHQSFIEKQGRLTDWSFFTSADDVLQKIRAGFTANLVRPCVDNVPRGNDAGVIRQPNTLRIDCWGNMFPALHPMNSAVIHGNAYMAINEFGLSPNFYRTTSTRARKLEHAVRRELRRRHLRQSGIGEHPRSRSSRAAKSP
ncbi:MAG: hypothetical protein OXU19_12500 [bacterium]|nr:hypothetical protein [bacterium]